MEKSQESIFQVSVEVEEINICVLKSQYEALFLVFEQINDFSVFTDNYLNNRAIKLNKFYEDSFQDKKDSFLSSFLRMMKKRVHE